MDRATKACNQSPQNLAQEQTITTLLTFRIVWNFEATLAIQVSFALSTPYRKQQGLPSIFWRAWPYGLALSL